MWEPMRSARRSAAAPGRARSSRAHRALHVSLVVAAFLVGALVVKLFALAECERDFRLAAAEIDLERNQRQSLTLDGSDHLADLLPVQQELARPRGLVIEVARLFVGRYVQIEQKNLSILNDRVRISDVGLSVPQRLDLAAGQNDSRFPGVEDVVVVSGAFVPRYRLLRIFLDGLCHLTSCSS